MMPSQGLQQRALAGPVVADDTQHLARLHGEAHVVQRLELSAFRDRLASEPSRRSLTPVVSRLCNWPSWYSLVT